MAYLSGAGLPNTQVDLEKGC